MSENGGTYFPGFPISLSDLAYAAPVIGAILLICFCISLCCYFWRRMVAPRGYTNSLDSSSDSFRNRRRTAQAQGQRPATNGGGGNARVGHQFVSWAREQIRNPVRLGQNRQAQGGGSGCNRPLFNNPLISPIAAQYPRTTQGGAVIGTPNQGTMPTAGCSTIHSDSEGYSQATAPPPSYAYAVGYQNTPTRNVPGYGSYQSTNPRGGDTGRAVEGGCNILPPPYEAAVRSGQNNTT